ncbi:MULTISPECIES: acyltransferase [Curtobacterium]|uniref:Acetylglucosamine-1-phosphate uridylyltransferase n=1 Tax=Curtobacterium oceanosedimentum TaxID=465820 RepID=A0A147DUQ8_9MICO|nr:MULTISPECIES: acyltransferase [Curtobacterium]KTR40476.1 acetylglucosamine-1-phosphate uridylyltransferase [Curtobacterium oceanosedimentum]KTR54351.1 acetylglucosamine-1-phosphate uridylyltransferase [Curtobacterium oceanosedimentum]UBQ03011.1 N-acetyltransferase [Curtobacterium sp. TXMA1]
MPEGSDLIAPSAPPFIARRAVVASTARLGLGTRVWDDTHVEPDVTIGAETVVGRGATVARGVRIGARCKIQNGALLYEPAVIGDGVFIGPGVVFTNDRTPRAVRPDGSVQTADDWKPVGVTVGDGASIGAGAVCIAPSSIGSWSMIAAGAVVTSDVPDFALMAGVPARRIGWVGRAGHRLVAHAEGLHTCPETGAEYRLDGDALREVSA